MNYFPLYTDYDQLAELLPIRTKKQNRGKQNIDAMLQAFESHSQIGFFKDIDSAIEYVDSSDDAIIHIDTLFMMMDFLFSDRNPGKEIDEAKAIRFEYNSLDIYDYSDDYFKKSKVKIPMCLPFKHIYPGNVDSIRRMISLYCMLWDRAHQPNQQLKLIRLNVFGRLLKRYSFYKIDPIYVRFALK
jgi:hypothetical protein